MFVYVLFRKFSFYFLTIILIALTLTIFRSEILDLWYLKFLTNIKSLRGNVLLMFFLPMLFIVSNSKRNNLFLAIVLILVFTQIRVVSLGDDWEYQTRVQPALWGSEILGSLFMKLVYEYEFIYIQKYYAPICGGIINFFFWESFRQELNGKNWIYIWFVRVFSAFSVLTIMMFTGFREVTIIALVPFSIFMYLFLDDNMEFKNNFKFTATVSTYVLSCLTHSGLWLFFPIFLILPLRVAENKKEVLIKYAIFLIHILVNVSLVVLLIYASGYTIILGNAHAKTLLWNVDGIGFLISSKHWLNVANILYMVSPFIFILQVLIYKYGSSRKFNLKLDKLLILSCAYICFISMVNFMFGFPKDIDLMIYASVPLLMYELYYSLYLNDRYILILGTCKIVVSILFYKSFILS